MNDVFILGQNIYNPKKFQELSTSTKDTVKFGRETPLFQLWNLISDNLKSEPILKLSKKKIKKWKCELCQCGMCKTYLQHIEIIS